MEEERGQRCESGRGRKNRASDVKSAASTFFMALGVFL